jgi:hypothetical protein
MGFALLLDTKVPCGPKKQPFSRDWWLLGNDRCLMPVTNMYYQ